MKDIYEIFDSIRFHPENETYEFKEAKSNFDFDEMGKYFSALSNEANIRNRSFAWLVFGVHDKSRDIVGTDYKSSPQSLEKLKNDLAQHLTDKNTFREIFDLIIENKLPEHLNESQKINKIKNLLTYLRKKGVITHDNKNKKSLWFLNAN
ncbi:MAG: ATP-binding protein [Erysipelotrichia bacterium]|nr:ATP-binding protein [Erysipelotrichia bacterium]